MISLIIPMYNSEETIKETLRSVIEQTVAFSEVIVVDNGSSDKSVQIVSEICQQYPYIHLFTCQEKGVASARNMGIELSTSPYIGFLDSDDLLSANYVEIITSSIINHPDAQMHHFNFQQEFKNGIIKKNSYFLHDKEIYSGSQFMEKTLKQFSFEAKHMVWSFVFQSEFLKKHNLQFNTEMTIFEDVLFLHNAWRKDAIVVIVDKELITYSWNKTSITNNKKEKQLIGNLNLLYSQLANSTISIEYLMKLTSRLLSLNNYLAFWKKNKRVADLIIYKQFVIDKIKYFTIRIKRKICK